MKALANEMLTRDYDDEFLDAQAVYAWSAALVDQLVAEFDGNLMFIIDDIKAFCYRYVHVGLIHLDTLEYSLNVTVQIITAAVNHLVAKYGYQRQDIIAVLQDK